MSAYRGEGGRGLVDPDWFKAWFSLGSSDVIGQDHIFLIFLSPYSNKHDHPVAGIIYNAVRGRGEVVTDT